MRWWTDQSIAMRSEAHFGRVMRCFAERPATGWEMLRAAIAAHGEREAIVGDEGRLSYAELDARSAAVAGALQAAGIAPGDRVAMLNGNRFAFVETLLACLRIGAISVPLNPRMAAPEIAFAVDNCAAAALIYDADLVDRLPPDADTPTLRRRIAAPGPGGAQAEEWAALLDHAPGRDVVRAEEDVAHILYTSGTTGRPKGAMLAHLNVVHTTLHFRYSMGITARDRCTLVVPASHVTGLMANIYAMLAHGGCVIAVERFQADSFLEIARKERMTHSLMVPAIYNLCLMAPGFDPSHYPDWRVGGYGGAPMPEATIARLQQALPRLQLINAYGATETTSPATANPPQFAASRADSVGQPLHCAEIRIMDDNGVELPPGEIGEIWIAGPSVVPGYWARPDANEQEFCGGYWKSGDLGAMDAEGFVQVLDRKKDMINRGGYKIFSAEVESALSFHPEVAESAVIAIPDPVLGEKIRAVVVVRDGAASGGVASGGAASGGEDAGGAESAAQSGGGGGEAALAEALKRHCRERLSDYKIPDVFTFRRDPLPRNANGKILKRELRAS